MTDFPCDIEAKASKLLKEHNLKSTPQRLAVLHVLHTSRSYMESTDIHEKVKRFLPQTGLATIYRTLECFEEIGLVARVYFNEGCHYYSISGEYGGHHMICTYCNKVKELKECFVEEYSSSITKKTGFRVRTHFLQLYGQCSECR